MIDGVTLDDGGDPAKKDLRDMCRHRWNAEWKQSTETGYMKVTVLMSLEGSETIDGGRHGSGTLRSLLYTRMEGGTTLHLRASRGAGRIPRALLECQAVHHFQDGDPAAHPTCVGCSGNPVAPTLMAVRMGGRIA